MDDNGEFTDYNEATLDPGWSFLVGAVTACVLLFSILPCLVSLGSRYERKKSEAKTQDDGETTDDNENENDGSSKGSSGVRKKVLIVDMSKIQPPPDVSPPTKSRSRKNERMKEMPADSEKVQHPLGDGLPHRDRVKSVNADQPPSATDTVVGWFCNFAEFCIIPPHPDLPKQIKEKPETIPSSGSSIVSHSTNVSQAVSSSLGGRPRRMPSRVSMGDSVASRPRSNTQNQKAPTKGVRFGRNPSYPRSHQGSVMSKLHHDDVSFNEAIDSYSGPGRYQLPREEGSGEVDILCGEHAWWKPSMIIAGFNRVVGIAEWDEEMTTIFTAAVPFSLQSALAGVFGIIDVALVGFFVGAREANAFIIISLFSGLTNMFNYGFYEALGSLVPFAIAEEDHELAGKCINASLSLYTVGSAPLIVFWTFFANDVVLWLGFDEATAELAQGFAFYHALLEWISGMDYCFHFFLGFTEHERYSAFSMVTWNVIQTIGVAVPILFGQTDLTMIGMYRLVFSAALLLGNTIIISCLGWVKPYSGGLLSLPDVNVLKTVGATALPLGVAYFLAYGEWDFLAIFASTLGPAEVAAWALLGYIWSLNKYFTAGVADAAEVRCAHHLGMNDPEMARLTAYKSIYLGLVSALFSTSALFLVGENLVRVITPDPTLQRLALELLPLIGVGQIVMSVGTMSWTLLGAQGRRRLATTVQLVGSWGVTIPLGLLFTYGVNINLQGLTTSVILGLSVAGAGNTYILLRSQWDLLAKLFSDGNALDDDTASQDMPPQEEMAPMNGGTNSQICGKSLLDQQGLQSIVDDSSSDGSFSVPLKHIRPTTAE